MKSQHLRIGQVWGSWETSRAHCVILKKKIVKTKRKTKPDPEERSKPNRSFSTLLQASVSTPHLAKRLHQILL